MTHLAYVLKMAASDPRVRCQCGWVFTPIMRILEGKATVQCGKCKTVLLVTRDQGSTVKVLTVHMEVG